MTRLNKWQLQNWAEDRDLVGSAFFFSLGTLFLAADAFHHIWAASLEGRSKVLYSGHTFPEKSCKFWPSQVVEFLRALIVDSVCRHNLARLYDVESSKRSFCTILSYFLGKRPSKIGIAHFKFVSSFYVKQKLICTWSRSSKSCAASFFIAEVFTWKQWIVSWPKAGIYWYLLKDMNTTLFEWSSLTVDSAPEWYHSHKHMKYAGDG